MSIDNIINTALSGNTDAQQLLGFYYYNGNEFEKDIQEAIFGMKKRLHKAMTPLNGATSVLIGKIKGKVS